MAEGGYVSNPLLHSSYYTLPQKFKAAKALPVIPAVLYRKNVNRVVSRCHFSPQGHSRAARLFAAAPSRENRRAGVFSSGIKNNKAKPDIFRGDLELSREGSSGILPLDGNTVCRYFRLGFWKCSPPH